MFMNVEKKPRNFCFIFMKFKTKVVDFFMKIGTYNFHMLSQQMSTSSEEHLSHIVSL